MGWAYAPSFVVNDDKSVGPGIEVIECAAFPGRGRVMITGVGGGAGDSLGYIHANHAINWLESEGGMQLRDLLGSRLNLDLTRKRKSYDIHFHLAAAGDSPKEEYHLAAAFVLAAVSMATGVPMDKEVRESN